MLCLCSAEQRFRLALAHSRRAQAPALRPRILGISLRFISTVHNSRPLSLRCASLSALLCSLGLHFASSPQFAIVALLRCTRNAPLLTGLPSRFIPHSGRSTPPHRRRSVPPPQGALSSAPTGRAQLRPSRARPPALRATLAAGDLAQQLPQSASLTAPSRVREPLTQRHQKPPSRVREMPAVAGGGSR